MHGTTLFISRPSFLYPAREKCTPSGFVVSGTWPSSTNDAWCNGQKVMPQAIQAK